MLRKTIPSLVDDDANDMAAVMTRFLTPQRILHGKMYHIPWH